MYCIHPCLVVMCHPRGTVRILWRLWNICDLLDTRCKPPAPRLVGMFQPDTKWHLSRWPDNTIPPGTCNKFQIFRNFHHLWIVHPQGTGFPLRPEQKWCKGKKVVWRLPSAFAFASRFFVPQFV